MFQLLPQLMRPCIPSLCVHNIGTVYFLVLKILDRTLAIQKRTSRKREEQLNMLHCDALLVFLRYCVHLIYWLSFTHLKKSV